MYFWQFLRDTVSEHEKHCQLFFVFFFSFFQVSHSYPFHPYEKTTVNSFSAVTQPLVTKVDRPLYWSLQ